MRRALGLVCLLWLGGAPLIVHAQEPVADVVPGVDGEESPELRALRLAELEIFGGEQARVETNRALEEGAR